MKILRLLYITIGLLASVVIIFSLIDLMKDSKDVTPSQKVESNLHAEIKIDVRENDVSVDLHDLLVIPAVEETFEVVFSVEDIDEKIYKRINGVSFKENEEVNIDDLRYLVITHYDFDGMLQYGELIVNEVVAEELIEVFKVLYEAEYPIHQVRLVDDYQGDDDASMADNNTHVFNYRTVAGTQTLSNHGYGLAIDINPLNNPYVKGTYIAPPGSTTFLDRTTYQQGMIIKNDVCYNAFIERGWQWGGDWQSVKDYQHFEKVIKGINQ